MANDVKITISAEDRTKAAFGEAKTAYEDLKTSWVGLAAKAAGITAAFYTIKSAIDTYREAVKAAASIANDIDRTSRVIGMTADQFQRMAYVAKMADVGSQEMAVGLKLLSRNMEEASRGTGQAAQWFTAMNISVKDANGHLRPLDAVMGDIAEKFAGWADGPRKIAIALDLFGRSGELLIPLLNKGKAGFQAMGDEANKLGGILSPELIKKGSEVEDQFKKMDVVIQAIKTSFMLAIAPVSDFASKIAEAFKKFVEFYSDPRVVLILKLLGYVPGLGALTAPARILAGAYGPEGPSGDKEKTRGEFYGEKLIPKPEPPAAAEDLLKKYKDYFDQVSQIAEAESKLMTIEEATTLVLSKRWEEGEKKAGEYQKSLEKTTDAEGALTTINEAETGVLAKRYEEGVKATEEYFKSLEKLVEAESQVRTIQEATTEVLSDRFLKLKKAAADIQQFWEGITMQMGGSLMQNVFDMAEDGFKNMGDHLKAMFHDLLSMVEKLLINLAMTGSMTGMIGAGGWGGLLGLVFPNAGKAGAAGSGGSGTAMANAGGGSFYVDNSVTHVHYDFVDPSSAQQKLTGSILQGLSGRQHKDAMRALVRKSL